ncbi:hypothetical protein G5I_04910 [Acromyrmex echinatior]|uniref:Uncharacterized protein n=1 Tax=Acromyrmex echinatior TaxID=103372 RepID=F4WGV9_ACREC|nr:hypothetical protein G5I_04910 [Acromyrmex echinatior]
MKKFMFPRNPWKWGNLDRSLSHRQSPSLSKDDWRTNFAVTSVVQIEFKVSTSSPTDVKVHLALAQNLKSFIHHSALTFSVPLSDCFRLQVRDRSYPTIVILWPRWIDIGVDKAAADFVPRRDCPRMISDPSSSGVKTPEEQPSWLLPRIWNVSREILRRFAPETSQRSYNVEDDLLCRKITYYAQYFSSCD